MKTGIFLGGSKSIVLQISVVILIFLLLGGGGKLLVEDSQKVILQFYAEISM